MASVTLAPDFATSLPARLRSRTSQDVAATASRNGGDKDDSQATTPAKDSNGSHEQALQQRRLLVSSAVQRERGALAREALGALAPSTLTGGMAGQLCCSGGGSELKWPAAASERPAEEAVLGDGVLLRLPAVLRYFFCLAGGSVLMSTTLP